MSIKSILNCLPYKMQRKEFSTDYTHYSFEDFLQDGFFISSINNPTEESITFWNNFVQNNVDNLQNYNAAKLYIESLPFAEGTLSEKEVENVWNRIEAANEHYYNRRSRRVYMTMAGAVACVAAVLIIFFLIPPRAQDSEIYMYANKTKSVDMGGADAQLILSDDKVVLIDDKESEITYEAENVNVKGETISKEEVAAYNELVVPYGKRSMLTFSEGTKVWVNAGTRVVYPVEFNAKEREIYVDGEIFIEVAPNKDWPFVVKTKDIGVHVLGTAFNVTAYEGDGIKRVVLASGSVKIIPKNRKEEILLSPDKMYEENEEGYNKVVSVNIYNYISWKDGMYVFEKEEMRNILNRLSAYYGVEILCDEASADLKCSGKLDLKKELYDVLSGLSNTAPVECLEYNGIYNIKYKQ